PTSALNEHDEDGAREACLNAALAVKEGILVKAERLSFIQEGETSFEVKLRDEQGVEWELMCAAKDARIYEIEREVTSADDSQFKASAKVSEHEAIATATAIFPGRVRELEYEIEFNGDPSYEIDIAGSNGDDFKVEVDAVSGRIIEESAAPPQVDE